MQIPRSLNDYASNDTAKFDVGYIDGFYDKLFVTKQDEYVDILEIGVHEGKSLKLWRDYFINGIVYGIDILDLSFLNNEDRIVPIGFANAYTSETIKRLRTTSLYGFDIIIDDGPHDIKSMVYFLVHYQNLLKPGGILVLEDIIDVRYISNLTDCLDETKGTITILNMYDKIKNDTYKNLCKEKLEVIIYKKDK